MKPHITDRFRRETPSRAAQYLALARARLPRRTSLMLQERHAQPAAGSRVVQFMRIARGRMA